jgi:hypothetical protein
MSNEHEEVQFHMGLIMVGLRGLTSISTVGLAVYGQAVQPLVMQLVSTCTSLGLGRPQLNKLAIALGSAVTKLQPSVSEEDTENDAAWDEIHLTHAALVRAIEAPLPSWMLQSEPA